MIQRLKYIVTMLLLLAALWAAGDTYDIDSVCVNSTRLYRVNGEPGSAYEWILTDSIGNKLVLPNPEGTDFSETDPTSGQPIQGSELSVFWPDPGLFSLMSIQTSALGCDSIQLGQIRVYEPPLAYAGEDATICPGVPYPMSDATASNYSSLFWTTSGDGMYDDPTLLHPKYTPGPNDFLAGTVNCTLTANGLGAEETCIPAVSTLTLTILKLSADVIYNEITCYGANDGNIFISTAFGGSGDYEYSTDSINWTQVPEFTNLSEGSYTVFMRDALFPVCSAILDTVEIIEPEPLVAELNHTDATCLGSDGTISVLNPTGGSGSYEFSLDEIDWKSSGFFIGLVPATYTVYMRDANVPDCKAIIDTVLVKMPDILTASVAKVNVSCYGANDGKIIISNPENGSGVYDFSIDGTTWTGSMEFNNLAPGNYDVLMRDFYAPVCMDPIGNITITQPDELTASVTSTNITCYGSQDGSITILNSTGGSGNFDYSIDGTNWTALNQFTNLGPGSYPVQMRDRNAPTCVKILRTIDITEPLQLAATVTPTDIDCFGANNGRIEITGAKNGTPGYEFTIDDGITWGLSTLYTGLGPDTYMVQIRDANGCTQALDTVIITEPAPLIADVASTNETCLGNDGTITISNPENSRSGLYQYTIDGISWTSGNVFTGLSSGTYTVQIRDANLITCARVIQTVLITEEEPLLAILVKTDVTCFNGSDGTISITNPEGGSGLYQYSLDGSVWIDQPVFTGLPAGNYTVLMRDAMAISCQYTAGTVQITEPEQLNAIATPVDVTCYGGSDGQIIMAGPSGGSGSYEYSIDGTNWFVDKIENLKAGNYTVQIRDAAATNCVRSLAPVTINQPEKLFANVIPTPVSCFGGSDGKITISDPVNGVGPYQFSMDGGLNWQSDTIFSGLKANTYILLVIQDANKCIATLDPVEVSEPDQLEASAVGTPETTPGAGDGTIMVFNEAGGSGVYEYSLDAINWQANPVFTGLAPDTYDVWVRDANVANCMISLIVKILPFGSINAEFDLYPVSCFGGNDGRITFKNPSGATNYQYSINGGTTWQTNPAFTGLTAQTYTLAVRDRDVQSNSTVLGTGEIHQPDQMDATATVTSETYPGGNDGSITVINPTGGSGIYGYSINGINWQSSPLFTGLGSGTYNVQIRDENAPDCLIVIQKIIQPAGSLSADVSHTNPLCDGDANGSITVSNPLGGSSVYEYSINGGGSWQGSGNFTSLAAGTYIVRIRDFNTPANNILLETVFIVSPPKLRISYANYVPPLCSGGTGRLTVTVSGGTPPYIGNYGPVSLAAGESRTFNVTDKNGCTAKLDWTMPNPEKIVATAVVITPLCYGEDGEVIISATGGTGNYGNTIGRFRVKFGASYTFIVRDNNGCQSNVISGQMPAYPEILVVTATATDALCLGGNGKVTVTVTGGTPDGDGNYTGAGTFDRPAGTYSFNVTDANGCIMASNEVTINEPPAIGITANVTEKPNCYLPTGTIRVTEPAGNNYRYSMDGGPYQVSPVFAGLAPESTHVFRARDALIQCETLDTTITMDAMPLNPAAPIVIETVLPSCYNQNGTVQVAEPEEGTGFEYSIDNGAYQPSATFAGLPTGSTHLVTVKDTLTGCISPPTEIKIGPIPPDPAAPVLTEIVSPTCFDPNGTVQVTNPAEGSGFEYSIDSGTYQSSATFAGLASGSTHLISVKNILTGCESLGTTITIGPIPANPEIPEAIVIVSPTCNDLNGTIEFTKPVGAIYEYNVNNGTYQSSAVFSGLKTDTYTIGVRDKVTGCTSFGTVVVPAVPPSPVLSATSVDPLCFGDPGTINFILTNTPDGDYVIKYTGGQFGAVIVTNGTASVEAFAGTYNNLTIEANGCTSDPGLNIVIDQPSEIVILTDSITEIDLKSQRKGAIDISISGGTGSYSIIWSNGEITEDIKNLSDGTYTVSVTDVNGCLNSKLIIIPPPNYPPVAVDDEYNTSCTFTTGDLLINDYDPEGDPFFIEVVAVENPLHGILTINSDGLFEYVAEPNFEGTDSFQYAIFDAKHYQGDTATVVITVVADFDHDGIVDSLDPDADGDGILNIYEGGPTVDADGDGHPNYLDIDSDNDGIVDNIEAQGTADYVRPLFVDTDKDGLDDAYDSDQNGKVIVPVDTDLTLYSPDGIPDFLDADSDNDLVQDYIEGHDANADGKPDYVLIGQDDDADGLDDGFDTFENICSPSENVIGSNAAIQDFDGDGLKDWRDENDDDDEYLTRFEDLNMDGDFSNDNTDFDGHPEYLDYGRDCDLLIPNAFSPNNDNIHDYFQIYCMEHFPDAKMYIFDQQGNKLFEKEHYGNVEFWGSAEQAWWDAKTSNRAADVIRGKVVPGTYYYVLQLGNGEVKKSFVFVSY